MIFDLGGACRAMPLTFATESGRGRPRAEPGVPNTRDVRVVGWEPAAFKASQKHPRETISKRFGAKRQK
jgi:hypothetical protein